MNPKQALIAIVAGAASAMLSLAFVSGSAVGVFFLVYLVPLPMLMAGMAMGQGAAIIAAGAGTALSATAGVSSAAMFAAIHGLPVWALTMLALSRDTKEKWYPAGNIAALMAVLACIYMAVASAVNGADLEGTVREYITGLLAVIAPDQAENVRLAATEMLTEFFPGIVGSFWVLMLGVNAIIAQGLLAKGGNNLRPSPNLRGLALPEWLSWALVGSAALALLGPGELGYLARNMFAVFMVPYFFLGLAVVHFVAGGLRFPAVMLGAVYMLIVATGWFAMVVGLTGILEQWVGLRRRMKPQEG